MNVVNKDTVGITDFSMGNLSAPFTKITLNGIPIGKYSFATHKEVNKTLEWFTSALEDIKQLLKPKTITWKTDKPVFPGVYYRKNSKGTNLVILYKYGRTLYEWEADKKFKLPLKSDDEKEYWAGPLPTPYEIE